MLLTQNIIMTNRLLGYNFHHNHTKELIHSCSSVITLLHCIS